MAKPQYNRWVSQRWQLYTVAVVLGVVGLVTVAVLRSPRSDSPLTAIQASAQHYTDLKALAIDSDLVIRGQVGAVVAREVDRGGDPEVDPESGEPIPGVPVMFVEIEVAEVLKSSDQVVGLGEKAVVHVVRFDTDLIASADERRLTRGAQVVLFLERVTAADAPGITVLSEFFAVVGGSDQGVLDVQGNRAVARWPGTGTDDRAVTIVEFDLSQLREEISGS